MVGEVVGPVASIEEWGLMMMMYDDDDDDDDDDDE